MSRLPEQRWIARRESIKNWLGQPACRLYPGTISRVQAPIQGHTLATFPLCNSMTLFASVTAKTRASKRNDMPNPSLELIKRGGASPEGSD